MVPLNAKHFHWNFDDDKTNKKNKIITGVDLRQQSKSAWCKLITLPDLKPRRDLKVI